MKASHDMHRHECGARHIPDPSGSRRGLVTVTAMVSILLVSITIGLLTSQFALEMRRTRELRISLQRDHLFHAAVLVALTRVRGTEQNTLPGDESLTLPPDLAANTACSLHFAAEPSSTIAVTITLRTVKTHQTARMTLGRRPGIWTVVDWQQ